MSVIIEFPRHRTGSGAAPTAGLLAEVVIFPGVRIEREDGTGLPVPALAKARRGAPAVAPECDLV